MSDFREDVAVAGNPRNMWSDPARDEDIKLGALGLADPLGAALWRLKYKGDARMASRALALMTDRLRANRRWAHQKAGGRTRSPGKRDGGNRSARATDIVDRLSFRVLMEWVNDRCTTCHGRGTVGSFGDTRRCPSCKGSTRQPPQHAARARDLGVDMEQYRKHWESVIDALLVSLEQVDAEVGGVLKHHICCTTLPLNVDSKEAA